MSRNPLPGLMIYHDNVRGFSALLGEHDNRYRMIRDIIDRALHVLKIPVGRRGLGTLFDSLRNPNAGKGAHASTLATTMTFAS